MHSMKQGSENTGKTSYLIYTIVFIPPAPVLSEITSQPTTLWITLFKIFSDKSITSILKHKSIILCHKARFVGEAADFIYIAVLWVSFSQRKHMSQSSSRDVTNKQRHNLHKYVNTCIFCKLLDYQVSQKWTISKTQCLF